MPTAPLRRKKSGRSARRRPQGRPARACPNDRPIRQAVAELLGTRTEDRCSIVGPREMGRTLRQHDWPEDTDPNEFYGFHTDDGRILVQDDRSVLHERIHDAGVDDRHIARWICEALSEEVAEHLHRTHGFPWVRTYPEYRRLLHEHLLAPLGLTGVQLAQLVARPPDNVRMDRWLASRLAAAGPRLRGQERALRRALGHDAGDDPQPLLRLLPPAQGGGRAAASPKAISLRRRPPRLAVAPDDPAAPLRAAVAPLVEDLPPLPRTGKGTGKQSKLDKRQYAEFLARVGIEIDSGGKLWITNVTDIGSKPPVGIEHKNLRKQWGRRVGLFSDVSKMPGYSFSLPAGSLAELGVCAVAEIPALQRVCNVCYARQGRYIEPTAQRALWQRQRWVERLLHVYGPLQGALFLAAAVRWGARPRHGYKEEQARQRRWNHFRMHDSGEFYSGAYAQLWAYTTAFIEAAAPPLVRFWFPTRSWALVPGTRDPKAKPEDIRKAVAAHGIMGPLVAAHALTNVVVRPSALGEGTAPPKIPGLGAGTGVWLPHGFVPMTRPPDAGALCIAPGQAGACWGEQECSECWHDAHVVFYHRHGGISASGAEAAPAKKRYRRKGGIPAAERMRIVRGQIQIPEPTGRPRGLVNRGRAARPDALWMVLDPQTRQVFARAWPSRAIAAAFARPAALLLVHVASGSVENLQGRCVGELLAVS